MSETETPVVTFDETRAVRIFPRPELKEAVYVSVAKLDNEFELNTYLRPEWGGVQQMMGDFYAIIKHGRVVYGSARLQWESMHYQISEDEWVKVGVPLAHPVTERCRVITLILQDDATLKEASVELQPGDWIVRQPGGEVQHIMKEKLRQIYFGADEIVEHGFDDMSDEQFRDWVLEHIRALQHA